MGDCRHFIAHWTTADERAQILDALVYARSVGDMAAVPLLLLRLTQPCDAREGDLAVDPNAALERLRTLALQILDSESAPEDPSDHFAWATDIAETFTGLDEWLTNRGFLPTAWAR